LLPEFQTIFKQLIPDLKTLSENFKHLEEYYNDGYEFFRKNTINNLEKDFV
jgi:hypothetical protein